jgi:peptide-methionine (S)-S-oxide reductase
MKSAVLRHALNLLSLAVVVGAGYAAAAPTGKSTTSAPVAKSTAAATTPAARSDAPAGQGSTAVATFAMGCFWSAESAFEGRPGVISVTSGYTGGHVPHPSYEEVSSGTTGHFEAIEVVYDPAKTTFPKLLDVFWHNVDPTQGDGQFCDRAPEYRSIVFYHSDAQRNEAQKSMREMAPTLRVKKPIVSQILPAGAFYAAEDYHQDFARRNPEYYQRYREGCGRDARLMQLWGKLDAHATEIE